MTDSSTPTLSDLHWDDSFTRTFEPDPIREVRPRQVTQAWSHVPPTPVSSPDLVSHSPEVLELLGLDSAAVKAPDFLPAMAGNRVLRGMVPHAASYGGHQFGHWAGQLGDGRAIVLGEVLTADHGRQTLQLKGAGLTPYSRTADGLAVLRSSVREYLCSEAMYHLGVPTTRALSLVTTGEQVVRDMFYDGNARPEPGAIVCRVAPSFLRFGNFQLPASRNDGALLKALADYTLSEHFDDLGAPSPETYVDLFSRVVDTTAEMIAHWMRVGFVHGVMNTDNMSIHGLTIDYGPYGWLEDWNPDWTPNTTDAHRRRYRFGAQPAIAHWNLAQLGSALVDLVGDAEPVQAALDTYPDTFARHHATMTAAKLGLPHLDDPADSELAARCWALLSTAETDMTIFFRRLASLAGGRAVARDDRDGRLRDSEGDRWPTAVHDRPEDAARPSNSELVAGEWLSPLADAYYQPEQVDDDVKAELAQWVTDWQARLAAHGCASTAAATMNAANPALVLRNWLAQVAIDEAEGGDPLMVNDLLDALRTPYDERERDTALHQRRPDWARSRAGCSTLSCSS